jgi:hypothetical protein
MEIWESYAGLVDPASLNVMIFKIMLNRTLADIHNIIIQKT